MLAAGKSFADSAKELGVEPVDSGFFARGRGVVPQIGADPKATQQLFALADGQVSPVLEFKDLVFCARLVERRLPAAADLVEPRTQLQEQLFQYKSYQMMSEYVAGLRKNAEITVMAGVLE